MRSHNYDSVTQTVTLVKLVASLLVLTILITTGIKLWRHDANLQNTQQLMKSHHPAQPHT